MKLDSASSVPLYQQLQDILRLQIARKTWGPGDKLPSEHDLCRQYDVTRPTVRQALEGLVREGLVTKHHGKGAFVTEPPTPIGIFDFTGTSDAFEERRLKVETRVLRAGLVQSCLLADGRDPAQGWVRLERMRRVNGVPTFYEFTWIDAALAPGLEKLNLNNNSLFRTLADRYSLQIDGGRQSFFAVPAPEKVGKALGLRPGVPLLRVVRHMNLRVQLPQSTVLLPSRHDGALRVDLYAASGPFVLEQTIPGLPTPAAAATPAAPQPPVLTVSKDA